MPTARALSLLSLPLPVALLSALTGCGDTACARWALGCPQPEAPTFVDRDEDGWLDEEDCDDEQPLASPSEPEDCDGFDNDCDGEVDEADGLVPIWYPDSDGDFYGAAEGAVQVCDVPEAYVAVSGDCDDEDEQVSPAQREACNAGFERSCDGWARTCAWSGHFDAKWQFGTWLHAEEIGTYGAVVEPIGDLDGDGAAELGLSLRLGADALAADGPRGVFIVPLAPKRGVDQLAVPEAALAAIREVAEAPERLGAAIGADDLDLDGQGDLLLGAPGRGAGGEGALLLFAGPFPGARTSDDAEVALQGGAGEGLGERLRAGVDLTADGFTDLVSSGRGADRVALFAGPLLSATAPSLSLVAEGAATELGAALTVGDLDGDGLPELIVGAPGAGDGTLQGSVYVFAGPLSPDTRLEDARVVIVGEEPGARAGAAIAAGELDGDGLQDLLIGGPGPTGSTTSRGAVWALWGGGSLAGITGSLSVAAAELRAEGSAEGDRLGSAVLCPGDFDRDGVNDAVAEAPRAPVPVASPGGLAYVWPGDLVGNLSVDALSRGSFGGEFTGSVTGLSATAPGDLNADGSPDLLFTLGDDNSEDPGGAAVFYGWPPGAVEESVD